MITPIITEEFKMKTIKTKLKQYWNKNGQWSSRKDKRKKSEKSGIINKLNPIWTSMQSSKDIVKMLEFSIIKQRILIFFSSSQNSIKIWSEDRKATKNSFFTHNEKESDKNKMLSTKRWVNKKIFGWTTLNKGI